MAQGAGVVLLAISLVYLLGRWLKNATVVDVFWGYGMAGLAGGYAWMGSAPLWRRLWVLALVTLASLRLGTYLLRRVWREHPHEDARYTALRQAWGLRRTEPMMYGLFLLQGLWMVGLSLPFAVACFNPRTEVGWLPWVGTLFWLLGWSIEALADAQLTAFKAGAKNQGKTCQVGLWAYSRHPNYVGQWLLWLGYATFAAGAAALTPWAWAVWLAPAGMYGLLRYVSGVPLAEAQSARRRADYLDYQRRVPVFFPIRLGGYTRAEG
jgi:steroid 5-alpha reductase family enzyme